MPDANGRFKGISVPALPWDKEQAEVMTCQVAKQCPYNWGPDCPHPACRANRDNTDATV